MRGFEARTKSVFAALGVMAVLALAGCSDPAEPSTLPEDGNDEQTNQTDDQPEPEPEDAPTPEPTKGGGKVTGYEPVDAATEAEVEDFVLEFMDAYDHAWLTGETADFEKLYTDECGQCGRYATYLGDIWGNGGRVEGGEYEDPKPEVLGTQQGDSIRVKVPTGVTAYKVFAGSGALDQNEPAATVTETFWVNKVSGSWRVVTWNTED